MNAENSRICQRIAGDALQHRPCGPQAKADQRAQYDPGQPEIKDHQIMIRVRMNPQQCADDIFG
ncbi:hypothetical protein D3C75_1055840 [compost metagenome]